MSLRRFLPAFVVLSLGCHTDDDVGSIDGALHADGYALFSVDNDRQQRNDVVITVRNVRPGETYVLLYSKAAPKAVGWFAFDPATTSRCGGDEGDHCRVGDYGWLIDTVRVPAGANDITFRDQRCGCNADRESEDWTGHWAVMRIERGTLTTPESPIHFEASARKVEGFTVEPDITQLQ
jgi:hypothetical protein